MLSLSTSWFYYWRGPFISVVIMRRGSDRCGVVVALIQLKKCKLQILKYLLII